MFNSPAKYKFVQKDRNNYNTKSFKFVHIYKFHIKNNHSLRKYIVKIAEFSNHLFTVEFYAKINDGGAKDNRYKILTNQKVMGRVGATVLSIIKEFAQKYKNSCFGIAAAPFKHEQSDNFTKRCKVYSLILSYTTKGNDEFELIVISKKSHIFIIRKKFSFEKRNTTLKNYEKIFSNIY